ncbi:type II toxin-antitoxin system RelE/ParE family toxin [Lawsonia intracellularis]|uniref:Plasmid stabilization system protein n=1 Tax=Lawsonia intracellularis (strain PHE/MN1-00) TaxID=363253 RepID=Q1MP09_LAWIP|nr:type II toxin-antitoxin system RelE/ParE family toxin [Lawsonia intracellularis]AGC50643.1 plasmid stabilization system protein [Lawsonia intracellularis N343]KAA0204246.1 type II toxin-antitoxin system RelE/ParE family toxin [Lawsonia intracellularis]MBZ3893373.1 type II toxin-antitoxin system RelE/ParE family toxin [Lawsonia intracellularis]OMQ02027.1 plasmid stabilization system protein [Lawsonia intracellularis]RBN31833.1 type II toxin-antitoxin system RelE/ParE family toxin [Lawsonia i
MSNNAFDVLLTSEAEDDLFEIFLYIMHTDSLEQAKIARIKLEKKIVSLSSMPERGKYTPELLQLGISTIRELNVHPWRIFYRIKDDHVEVAAIFDGRRNLEDILLNRLVM